MQKTTVSIQQPKPFTTPLGTVDSSPDPSIIQIEGWVEDSPVNPDYILIWADPQRLTDCAAVAKRNILSA